MALRRLLDKQAEGLLRYTGQAFGRALSGVAAQPAVPDPITNSETVSDTHRTLTGPLEVPSRLLMGPGPSNAHPRVLAAQALPLLGHLHPPFLHIMDEIQGGLKYLYQTDNGKALLVSGSGHAGMEATIANSIEPGQTIVVGANGIWGQRACDVADRYGAKVVPLECPPGGTFSYSQIKEAMEQHKPAALFVVQGESSTGAHQSLVGLGELCAKHDALFLVDTVCSLGGVEFWADAWGVDVMYSGTQKVLSAAPGSSPFFMSQKAFERLNSRKSKVSSYYFDAKLFGDYWGWYDKRFYHHTGCVSTWYGVREALAIVADEGLSDCWKRHETLHHQLWDGLRSLGLKPFVEKEEDRLVTVNTIASAALTPAAQEQTITREDLTMVPEGVDWQAVINNAMQKYNLEISGGLGPSAGKVWRVGIMGYNANPANVELVISAFRDGLKQQGKVPS